MKKNILIICLIICTTVSTALASSETIKAYLVDYDVSLYGNLNDRVSYPLISYNDNTYIALRDFAKEINREIFWNEESKTVYFRSKSNLADSNANIIKEEKTALAIGKAIIEEYFGDKINENSIYNVRYIITTALEYDDVWGVYVKFNPEGENALEEDINDYDVSVQINAVTGNFKIYDSDTEETVVDFIMQ